MRPIRPPLLSSPSSLLRLLPFVCSSPREGIVPLWVLPWQSSPRYCDWCVYSFRTASFDLRTCSLCLCDDFCWSEKPPDRILIIHELFVVDGSPQGQF